MGAVAWRNRVRLITGLGVCCMLLLIAQPIGSQEPEEPSLRLRANPNVAFAPANVTFVAEFRGGDDDYRDLYCVTVEWDWDDDTRSSTTPDCDPYEPGVSQIQRRYTARHRFTIGGRYNVRVRFKQRDDVVATRVVRIEVRGRF